MYTVDLNCSRCVNKKECKDRIVLITELSATANKLNTEEYLDGPGDGRLVVACSDFKPE